MNETVTIPRVPAAVLDRLAIDRRRQGRGLGETLLLDAIRRVVRASATIAVYAVIVDAKKRPCPRLLPTLWLQGLHRGAAPIAPSLQTSQKLGL